MIYGTESIMQYILDIQFEWWNVQHNIVNPA